MGATHLTVVPTATAAMIATCAVVVPGALLAAPGISVKSSAQKGEAQRPALSTHIKPRTEPKAGTRAWFEIELKNDSRSEVLLALDEMIIRSLRFSTDDNDVVQGRVQGSMHERTYSKSTCVEDFDVFSLKPGLSAVRIIALSIPSNLSGKTRIEVGIQVPRISEALECGLPELLSLTGAAVVEIRRSE